MNSGSGKTKIDLNVSSDVVFDQRVMKFATALQDAGVEVRITGRQIGSQSISAPEYLNVSLLKWLPRRGIAFYLALNLWLFVRGIFSDADLFLAVDLDTLPGTWLAAFIKRKKVVLDAHEHYVESPELVGRPLKKKVWQKMAIWFIPRTDLRFTVNKELAEVMGQLYRSDFKVIRNMPVSQNITYSNSRKKVIWYQGAVNYGRKLYHLIDALEYMPDFKIEIAGDGDLFQDLRNYALSNNKSDRVIFHGRMNYNEMQERAAQCLIGYNLLSDEGENYRFSLANKFFDYVQSGLPSINSNFPVYRRYLSDYSVGITLAHNIAPEELASAILELVNDPTRFQKFSDECEKARMVWIWENEKQRLVSEVMDVLQNRGL